MSNRNDVHKAVEQALKDHPKLHEVTVAEVTRWLMLEGYLQEEPPLSSVADELGIVKAEEDAFAPGIRPADI